MLTLTDHRVDQALWCPSPNYNARPDPGDISLLVVHNISLPPGQFGGAHIEAFFQNRLDTEAHPFFADLGKLNVSAHFLIRRDGELVQFVDCHQRAWHAGVSQFSGRENCNDFALGVELEGTDHVPYTTVQYRTLARLTHLLQRHYPAITADRITGHEDIAPGRKTDPGPAFDWSYYRQWLTTLLKQEQ